MNKLKPNKRHPHSDSPRDGRPRDAYDFTPQETRQVLHLTLSSIKPQHKVMSRW